MRKESSTNSLNEQMLSTICGMAYTLRIVGGRWKPTILCRLTHETMRYGELKKSIVGISERMLAAQLDELEQAKVIERIVYPEVPPRVEYRMTELGRTMIPMLDVMSDWGNAHREKVGDNL